MGIESEIEAAASAIAYRVEDTAGHARRCTRSLDRRSVMAAGETPVRLGGLSAFCDACYLLTQSGVP